MKLGSTPLVGLCAAALFGCGGAESNANPIASVATLKAEAEADLPAVAAAFAGAVPETAEAIYPALDDYLASHPNFYASTFAVDPSRVPGGLAPYSYRTADGLAHKDLAQVEGYDFTSQDWYKLPKESGVAAWSEPYFDAGGGDINMVTYSLPVMNGGSFLGILTTDIGIDGRPAQ